VNPSSDLPVKLIIFFIRRQVSKVRLFRFQAIFQVWRKLSLAGFFSRWIASKLVDYTYTSRRGNVTTNCPVIGILIEIRVCNLFIDTDLFFAKFDFCHTYNRNWVVRPKLEAFLIGWYDTVGVVWHKNHFWFKQTAAVSLSGFCLRAIKKVYYGCTFLTAFNNAVLSFVA
jgi:hypothetical protein